MREKGVSQIATFSVLLSPMYCFYHQYHFIFWNDIWVQTKLAECWISKENVLSDEFLQQHSMKINHILMTLTKSWFLVTYPGHWFSYIAHYVVWVFIWKYQAICVVIKPIYTHPWNMRTWCFLIKPVNKLKF